LGLIAYHIKGSLDVSLKKFGIRSFFLVSPGVNIDGFEVKNIFFQFYFKCIHWIVGYDSSALGQGSITVHAVYELLVLSRFQNEFYILYQTES